jgi:alpha-methylacyl-CoA racemase
MHAALAICIALLARQHTGRGQYVDIAMSDGVMSLMTSAFTGYFSSGNVIRPGQFLLNGAVPWYNTYECSDGRWFSLGSIEPHFYAALCNVLGTTEYLEQQHDASIYPEMRERWAGIFRTKTADEWMAIMSQHDICAAPVMEMDRAASDPHNTARGMVIEVDSPIGKVKHIGVGAKLSDTPGKVRSTSPLLGQHTDEILAGLGYDAAKIASLRESGAVG